MEYFNNIFCISKPDLTCGNPRSDSVKERPVMSEDAIHKFITRYPHIRVRKGGGSGCPVLLNYDMLRSDIKLRIYEKYGDVKVHARKNKFTEMIEPDFRASVFFSSYMFDDETPIKPERQVEYNTNAMILNAIGKFVNDTTARHKSLGNKTSRIWQSVSESVNNLDRTQYPHTLPSNPLRLKDKYRKYAESGYTALIHKGIGNANARLANDKVERLIISIYCMDNLPFSSWVYDNYLQFLSGKLLIVDKETGTMFDREDFFDEKKGAYLTISRGTVWNIINNPANAIIIDRLRNNRIDHITKMTPYNHRKPPRYSLSKISMDDRTFSRKTTDGKWLNVYVAFDVMSGCELASVYTTESPSHNLVWDCFRDMFHTINKHHMMWPGEVEVENHLMKDIEEELRQMFTYVTFCAPGLSRSKRAEHFIHYKKYFDEKRYQVGIGRWNQKGPYKIKSENKDEDYKQPRLPVETLIAEDQQSIRRYNNALHPNQKMFPGKTRWQVLMENQNPDLGRPQKHKLLRYLGLRTETSIRNNDFAQIQYEKYAIDNLSAISRLKPNNYSVEAYYVPDMTGNIEEVYLYQEGTFITRATKIEKYNEARMERTPHDEEIRTHQAKRQAHFFKVEREGIQQKVTRKMEIISSDQFDVVPTEVEIAPEPVIRDPNEDLEDWMQIYTGEWAKQNAIESF